MQVFLFLSIVLLFCSKSISGSTCIQDGCTLSDLFGCVKDISTNAIDVLTKPQSNHAGPIDCLDIQREGNSKSGIYRIWPLNWQTIGSLLVFCDMDTEGGGWTVIQRRGNYKKPQDYFYKDWFDYSVGFGDLNEDFWLGNEWIFALTSQGNYSLRIDMKDTDGNKRYALYDRFWIENEKHQYRLHVSGYSGDAGDSFTAHNNMRFSTKDRDNDEHLEESCAQMFKGGWWYDKCHHSNINGLYLDSPRDSYPDGVEWYHWEEHDYSLPEVDMKIKRL